MLDFPLWKKISILGVCLFSIILSLPNLLDDVTLNAFPDFMPSQRVNLGLDLRGGSHLLYQVDVNTYFAEALEDIKSSVRSELRENRIGYRNLRVDMQSVRFSLREEQDAQAMTPIIEDIDPDLDIEREGSDWTLTFSDHVMAQKTQQLLEQSIEIINRRVNESGTKEPLIQRQGDDRILVQVPGVENPEALKAIIGKTAKMTFHLVNHTISEEQLVRGIMPAGTRVLRNEGRDERVPIYTKVELSGEMLTGSQATFQDGQPVVAFSFNALGARKFGDITQKHVGKRFAVVLDNKVITAPVMNVPILDGRGIIEGNFTVESANELALLLRAGALPAPLKIIEERSVGPSLGADSIAAGEKAVMIAFVAIMVFMALYYGRFGLFSNVALIMNVVIIMAVLSLFQATLTLPGIAGIVLTMGMAVDANTLIFERIREELHLGKGVRQAIDHGFSTAFNTILDANVTTLIAAFILFYFGSGTVKGFAVTLSIGILSSMFSAIMLTRFFVDSWVQFKKPKTLVL